jgi:hypothetical protein
MLCARAEKISLNFHARILRSTNTIEDAIYIISRKLEMIHKVLSELRKEADEGVNFPIVFLRNMDPNIGNNYLTSIELLL